MIGILLVGCSALASAPEATPPATPVGDRTAYDAAKAQAGRDPSAHVRLALWCEAHGMTAERLKHLGIAIVADPKNVAARSLLGLVSYAGKWQAPEAVAARVRSDADLAAARAEYEARRQQAPATADGQWQLARWCEQKGLKAEATAHLTTVVRLDPSREAAWKRLGYKKQGGRWATDEQVAAARAEAAAQKQADRRWAPLLEKWKGLLARPEKRAEAERLLAGLSDPRAVPAVGRVFGRGAADQGRSVQLLGQIAAPSASRALAVLAISSESAEVRRSAIETLRGRDAREFLGLLIALVREPIAFEVRPVGGPGSPGGLFVQGQQFNVQRLYAPPALPDIRMFPGETIYYDAAGLPVLQRDVGFYSQQSHQLVRNFTQAQYAGQAPVDPEGAQLLQQARQIPGNSPADLAHRSQLAGTTNGPITVSRATTTVGLEEVYIPIGQMIIDAQRTALVAQQQLQDDVAVVQRYNAGVRESNDRVVGALAALTGEDLGADRTAWSTWWTDQQGYVSTPTPKQPRPTVVEDVALAYQPQPVPLIPTQGPILQQFETVTAAPKHHCFAAGTPVQTLDGLRSIESLQAGDQILSQDTDKGALSFQPVVAVYHNRPSRTLKITLGDEEVVATPIHRFWVAGRGWVMARDLKPDDAIRTAGGVVKVVAVESDRVQPVFNVEVARGQSFFVGRHGFLVHDNSLVSPTPQPFDAAPELAAAR